MELTLSSALSQEGLLGHAAYVFLIISMLMRTLLWLRLLVIVSAILGITYAALILGDPVSTFWETLLVLVNIAQILLTHWRSIRARFTPAEADFAARHLPGLTRGEARGLIDMGDWVEIGDGMDLTTQDEAVAHLSYIASGSATVSVDGHRVSICGPGDFVGEMTALSGLSATATVTATGPMSLWRIPASALRDVSQRRVALSREIEAAFARNYCEKIVAMNRLATGRMTA